MARPICAYGEDGRGGWDLCFLIPSQSRHWDSGRRHVTSNTEGVPAVDGVLWQGTYVRTYAACFVCWYATGKLFYNAVEADSCADCVTGI